MAPLTHFTIRRARPEDAAAITPLINDAGEGVPLHLWRGMAAPGEDPWALAARRWAEKIRGLDVAVADLGEGPAACLVGYPLGSEPTAIDADTPALLHPVLELENQALGSWYVNMLATSEAYRGRGLAWALLQRAEKQARRDGCSRLSLIVADKKDTARRLYARAGFVETARRSVVESDGWRTDSRAWILMIREI